MSGCCSYWFCSLMYSSDLWALGVIIYLLLSGKAPFKGATTFQTFELIKKRDFSFPEYFSDAAKDIIDKLLVCANLAAHARTCISVVRGSYTRSSGKGCRCSFGSWRKRLWASKGAPFLSRNSMGLSLHYNSTTHHITQNTVSKRSTFDQNVCCRWCRDYWRLLL